VLFAAYVASSRPATAKVDAGPVGERIVARAVVVPSAGVRHVFATADGRISKVIAREGDSIEAGQALAELTVAGQTQTLTAPQRAVVLARSGEVGDYVLAAERGALQPLFELADPSQTELRVEVEESDAASLKTGLPATLSPIGASTTRIQGRVTRVSARLERRSIGADDARVRADGLVRVATVAWSGAHPGWPLGARAEAIVEVRRRDAAARVPRAALSVRDGRTVVERPGALWATEVPVEVLSVDDAYAEIRGLAAGAEVVVPKSKR
jgi:multidrug efflux pump subunit AcrA (membrane-fusion protein)